MTEVAGKENHIQQEPHGAPDCEPRSPAAGDKDVQAEDILTARFTFTPDYLVEAFDRYCVQRKWNRLLTISRIDAISFFGIVMVVAFWHQDYEIVILFTIFTFLLIAGHFLDDWYRKRSWASLPFINEEFTLQLSDSDFHERSSSEDTRIQWPAFTKVVYFDDGVLIFHGPKLFHWLPSSAFDSTDQVRKVELLLRSKIPQHKDRRTKR